ncbi:MAG: TIGR01777 family oxidoreductase [Sedimentisphaerales bacterium]|nr:TIGR01777 family oxidoreductase [Sedimentisphaerales bacterium]
MKIAVSGSSGLIGSAIVKSLLRRGDTVLRLVRRNPPSGADEIFYRPDENPKAIRNHTEEWSKLNGLDAVIHLAGESIAGRWSPEKKKRIYASRVNSTQLLAQALAESQVVAKPPRVFLCASAVGYYGDRGREILTEESAAGKGFLTGLCKEWEAAARPLTEAGIRVAHLRFAVVLSPQGGALPRMLPLFRLGLGGRLGSGAQYMSWITLEDAVCAIFFVLDQPSIIGPVNVTSPNPVTNAEFTRALASVLRRPAWFSVPAPLLRWSLGEFAEETVLASTRAIPQKLRKAGFSFQDTDLNQALSSLLARPA